MLKEIIKFKKCEYGDFEIPEFSINNSCMVRFWVQKPTISENSYSVDQLMKFIKSELENKYDLTIQSFTIPFKKDFKYFFKSFRVVDFLNDWNLKEDKKVFEIFGIKKQYKIEQLGHNNLKLLALMKLFSNKGTFIFDFYGVDPSGEENLTNYIESKLCEGKNILAFDDLNYKQDFSSNNKNTFHVVVKRKNL